MVDRGGVDRGKSGRPGGGMGREPRAPGRPLRLARGKRGLEGKGWSVAVAVAVAIAVAQTLDLLLLVEVPGRQGGANRSEDGLGGQLDGRRQVRHHPLGGSDEVGAGLIHPLLAGQTALRAGAAAEGGNDQQGQQVKRAGPDGKPGADRCNPAAQGDEAKENRCGFYTEV
jgi:hypothetical protein